MSPTPSTAPTRLGRADFATMAVTFFSLGVTLQVALIEAGTPPLQAFVGSAVIYAATSQFAWLAVIEGGGTEWAAVLAGWVVATRFGILAVSLVPRLPGGWVKRALAAVHAFDPNVAVAMQQRSPGEVEQEFWRTTAAMFAGWLAGLAVGTWLGNVIGDAQRLGLDAVFPAALLAIIANLLRTPEGRVAGIAGGLICLALLPIAPAGFPIILSVVGVWFGARLGGGSGR